jgi:hypothetical protein|tara:strand:- start:364 stop:1110 length:747 start_codon:yes stop_codon:yes gene_type:complete
MPLPKIDAPVFDLTLPVSGTKIKYRPFTVREEKILLIAQQQKDVAAISQSIKQVVQNCILNDVTIQHIPTFEVEYLFIRLRSTSINNVIKLNIQDPDFVPTEEQSVFSAEVEINLDDVTVDLSREATDTVKLNDEYNIKLKYPTYDDFDKINDEELEKELATDIAFDMIGNTIDSVYSNGGDEVFVFSDYTKTEKREFLESLSSKNFADIQKFLSAAPAVSYTISYINHAGEEKSRELRGLIDFFTFV